MNCCTLELRNDFSDDNDDVVNDLVTTLVIGNRLPLMLLQ